MKNLLVIRLVLPSLALLCCTVGFRFAEPPVESIISGKVFALGGSVIAGANISRISGEQQQVVGHSDANGAYSLSIEVGAVYEFSASGYNPFRVSVQKKGSLQTLNVYLKNSHSPTAASKVALGKVSLSGGSAWSGSIFNMETGSAGGAESNGNYQLSLGSSSARMGYMCSRGDTAILRLDIIVDTCKLDVAMLNAVGPDHAPGAASPGQSKAAKSPTKKKTSKSTRSGRKN